MYGLYPVFRRGSPIFGQAHKKQVPIKSKSLFIMVSIMPKSFPLCFPLWLKHFLLRLLLRFSITVTKSFFGFYYRA